MTIAEKQVRTRTGAYFRCETCGKEFYAYPSTIRKAQKRGCRPRFCSMACYDKTGDKNPFWGRQHNAESVKKMVEHPNRPRFGKAEDNPNFVRWADFVPPVNMYGARPSRRDKLFERKRKVLKEKVRCERCGIEDHRVLTIHHKDRNKRNNKDDNLEVLCWNCHVIDHYDAGDGLFKHSTMLRAKRKERLLADAEGR